MQLNLLSPKFMILAGLGLSILVQIPNWAKGAKDSHPSRTEVASLKRTERDRINMLRAQSRIALDRYRAGCVEVSSPSGAALLLQGDTVTVKGTNEPLTDGVIICKGSWTGVVVGGTANDIARVSLEEMSELQEIQAQIEEINQ